MVLTRSHKLWFEQKYEKFQIFLSDFFFFFFHFLVVKFSVYLNRHVFVMLLFCHNTDTNTAAKSDSGHILPVLKVS